MSVCAHRVQAGHTALVVSCESAANTDVVLALLQGISSPEKRRAEGERKRERVHSVSKVHTHALSQTHIVTHTHTPAPSTRVLVHTHAHAHSHKRMRTRTYTHIFFETLFKAFFRALFAARASVNCEALGVACATGVCD